MNVEIVEFYPDGKNDKGAVIGTIKVRIRLPDLVFNLLGIRVSKSGDRWFFLLPSKKGRHHETGETVWYPFFCFDAKEKHRALMEAIREKGRAFVEKWLADKGRPLDPDPEEPKSAPQTEKTTTEKPPKKLDPPPLKARESSRFARK